VPNCSSHACQHWLTMWLMVPHVFVVLCVCCCFMARLSPKSASLAVSPAAVAGVVRTSTLRAFCSGQRTRQLNLLN
jgi:hypothetical protein